MRTLILILLAALALAQSVTGISESLGVDFHQFWSVPVALRLTDEKLGTPYKDGQRYIAVVKRFTAQSDQPRLKVMDTIRTGPDFAGAPLLYTLFAPVPTNYSVALGAFQVLQILSFLAACVLLGRWFGADPVTQLSFGLLCVAAYQPLLSDVRVANFGCFQLLYLTGVLWLMRRVPTSASLTQRVILGSVSLSAAVLLALCKPNVVLVAAFLAAHLAVRHGLRVFALSAVPAVGVGVLGIVVPCLYFGTWSVWREWYDFVYGSDANMLVRRLEDGNYSTVLLLSTWLGTNIFSIALALLVLLALSLLGAALWGRAGQRERRSGLGAVMDLFAAALGDPQVALSAGILLTIATAPLNWFHYFVLAMLPALWVLGTTGATRYAAALATASVVMSSGAFRAPLFWLGWNEVLPPTIALSWVPLWGALLMTVGTHGAIAVAPVDVDEPVTESKPARRPRRA